MPQLLRKISILPSVGLVLAAIFMMSCSSADESSDQPPASSSDITQAQRLMSVERMFELVKRIDAEAVSNSNALQFTVEGHRVMIVFDQQADRMRIVIPIKAADKLSEDEKTRILQANFDSALDARYALAQGVLWGVFIHPLSTLSDEELLVGLGQTVNVVTSFGSSYSSGMFIFGGGDSAEIERRKLIDDLKRKAI